jgi:hypothetical protein
MELECQLGLLLLVTGVSVLTSIAGGITMSMRSNAFNYSWAEGIPNLFPLQFSAQVLILLSPKHIGLSLAHDSRKAFLRVIHLFRPGSYLRLIGLLVSLSYVRYSVSKVKLLHLLLRLRDYLAMLGWHNSKVVLLAPVW